MIGCSRARLDADDGRCGFGKNVKGVGEVVTTSTQKSSQSLLVATENNRKTNGAEDDE